MPRKRTSRQNFSPTIIVLFDSRGGLTEQLANEVAKGARSVPNVAVPSCRIHETDPSILHDCDAIILGSPNWGGVTGALKTWFDGLGELWETGEFTGKIGAAFTAGASRSGGIEATLSQLLHLLLANGLIVVGLPWTNAMRISGSYYGATAHGEVTNEDR